ncbi:DUF3237 domain-containing protein [Hyphomonas sp.]|uniref:DUF3237 domain-containing protein n=1 Tax=Hyphomonas sp. TaxID=87 RepID=UPI0025BCBDD5|nr:DUF3237 domain-containing protein [Hyphomonas sp.]
MIPSLTPVAQLEVFIARPLVIGAAEAGIREVIPITGGSVDGPLLQGTVLPGGADWCLTRPDGIAEVWARYTIQTNEGHLVSIINSGFAHPNGDGSYGGRTIPRFEVATGPLDWLCRSVFVGTLLAHASGDRVNLAFFRVD